MALNELDQSLLSNESLAGLNQTELASTNLDASSLDQATMNEAVNNPASPASTSTNLLVQSLNKTTEQTTVRPKGVSASNPMLRQMSGAPAYKTSDDFYAAAERNLRQNPLYESGYGTPKWTPTKEVEKFDDQDYGYLYGMDNNDFYGKMESGWATAGKAVPRLAMGIINKIGEGVGFVSGLINPWNWGEAAVTGTNLIDIAADNAIYKIFEASDEWTKNEWLPTFQEAADREKGFWSRVGTDGDFWADDVVDGVSFLAAAWVPGAVLGELGAGAAMASRLSRGARALGLAGDIGATVEEAGALTNWFNQTGKAARQLDAFNSWAIATSSEAMFEASQVRNDILNSPDYDINGNPILNPLTGKAFTPDEKKKMAAQGAMNTFMMNAAVLGISNVFEYKYLSKLMGKAAPSTGMGGLIGGAATLGEEAVVTEAPKAFWKTFAKETILGTAREGFGEENMQLAIQRYNTKYGQEGRIGGIFDADTWTDMLKQVSKQTVDAIYGRDTEAAQSIGIGGLIGSIFGTGTSRYQENKEYKRAEALMTAFNESQNSWLKFGDVFKYETVDAVDKDGNPIKTKKIVLDEKGNPVYDLDKIASVATGMKLNADMFNQSFNEVFKYNQNLLRSRAWADFVGAHINAGLEKTLMAKLDKLETADPVALAKLGFIKDENFGPQLEKYRNITSEIIRQNKALTDNVLFRNTSFFDKKNIVENNRRAKLVEMIGNNVVNKEMAKEVKTDLDNLKSQLITDEQTHLTDGVVEQLNNSLYRIKSQEQLIEKMKKNGADKILPMEIYERVLANLKTEHAELLKDNETTIKELVLGSDGTYQYKKAARNNFALTNQLNSKSRTVSELKNELLNDAEMFSFFADPVNGRDNFAKYFNAVAAEKAKIAEERVEQERKKKADDEAKAKIRQETEHVVIKEIDGTFTIVNPDGVVIEQGLTNESEANQKAAEYTSQLIAKKDAEIKAKEEEERKKQQQQNKNNQPAPISLAEKKQLVIEKQNQAKEIEDKGYEDNKVKIQELRDQGKTRDEAVDIVYNEWLATPDGKAFSKIIAEVEALEKEIEDEESSKTIPTLEEYLRAKYDNLVATNPMFKQDSYEAWYDSGAANGYIRDYNREHGKTEKVVPVAGTSTPVVIDEEAIGNLDLKDLTMGNIQAGMRAVRKVYEKIAGDQGLVQKLIDKINEIKDDMVKNTILQSITKKATDSTYIPLSTVGVTVNVEEHKLYDRINMPAEEFMLGFTVAGDPEVLKTLSGATGEITDRVIAKATTEYVQKSNELLENANIPNRTIITSETPKDIAKLNKGLSVIAKAHRMDGFGLQLFLKDSSVDGNAYVQGIGGYAIVHPDNTTEKITWSEEQREFVKENMLLDGKKMTDQQYNTLQEMYNKMQAFEQAVMAEFQDYLQINPDATTIDITEMFKDAFTLSGQFKAVKGESLKDVIDRAGPDRLFRVQVADENDVVTEKLLPLFAFETKGVWSYQFPLNPGERIVTLNDSNELEPVLSIKDYLRDEHNLKPEMTEDFAGSRAWISKAEYEERGYKPYKLSVEKVQSPATFKSFAKSFKELKQAIETGLAEGKNIFKYDGKTYSTIQDMLMAFNIENYGFYQYKGFVANLSYNPKAKVNGKTVGRFLFEIRPQSKKDKLALTQPQKRALNMYISDEAMLSMADDASDVAIGDAYTNWVNGLVKDFDKLLTKLKNSDDTTLKKMADETQEDFIAPHLLFEYDLVNNTQKFKLKLVDKSTDAKGTAAQMYPFLKFDGTGIGVNPKDLNSTKYQLRLTFNDVAPNISQNVAPTSMGNQAAEQSVPDETDSTTGSTAPRDIIDEINPEDNDSPFMLEETEENYEKYTESTFNAEVEWLKKALAGSGVRLEDLGTIINNLATNKQVLGYYKNKAIYVSEALSKKGTIFHEAFHALFRDVMTAQQRRFYIDKIKTKVGYITNNEVEKFRNDRGYFNKTDEEIRDLIYEEHLADGFRKWKLEQKQPSESWFKKFINIFDRIINFFKGKQTEIEGLYQDFDAGKYSGINREASTISQEGVFQIAYGRPRLFIKDGATGFTSDNTQVLNGNLQNELVYKLTNIIAGTPQGTFTEKFNNAVQQLKKDYDIEQLIKNSADPDNYANAIRSRYGEMFNDALYILGDSVPYVLSEELQGASDAMSKRTIPGANKNSLDLIKKAVENKIDSLGLEKGFDVDNLELPETDEDLEERQKGGEFDTIHMNPLQGLSREFRSLFSTIPYEYTDDQLGVTIKKMADGNMLYNAMIKIAANTPLDQILPSLAKAVNTMKEDNDRTSVQLEAFQKFIEKQFGITDLSDPEARPSKNIYLYKQFIDTFFVTELASRQVVLTTTPTGSSADVFDASINADMNLKKDQIKYHYEQAYRRLATEEQKTQFEKNFDALKEFILTDLLNNLKDPGIVNDRSRSLNKLVNKTKKMLDDVNIVLPKNLIRQSFLAIYNIENELDFSPQSRQNRLDMEADQRLMREGAYLQSDFFLKLATVETENRLNIFADTKESSVDLGKDYGKVRAINSILKKAMKYAIKYDVNSAISVFQNAENKKIWRYSRYTPPILLAQMVREYGIEAISEMYPVLRDWFGDNPLFDGSAENELFLENLEMSAFGGFRQELDDDSKVGSTFGNIDTKALLISNIVHFMNRETITKKMKGIKDPVSIITYNRSRTQEEATTTNFLMTAKYQKLVTSEGRVNNDMINTLEQMLKQEYNRIQREWSNRENTEVLRYNGYNNNVHPETKSPILGDSYTTLDGKTVMLRAYQFKNFEHFFDQQKTSDQNAAIRDRIKNTLKELAKTGVSFEEAMNMALPLSNEEQSDEEVTNVTIGDFLKGSQREKGQLEKYMDETFDVYMNALKQNNILTEKEDGVLSSDLIPSSIKLDFTDPKAIQDYGYESISDLLKDQHLNTFMSKMLVNQIFDGDIATGIKSAVEYYKRNKSGVISGNSMKFGFFRTSVIEDLVAEINQDDLTQYAKDVTDETPSNSKEKIADGQSYHTMNHRIRMMDAWGRVDSEVRQLLNAAKYRKLTTEEIDFLENRKVVLNSIKTATGGVFEYYKLSEHLISRTEVSHLVPKRGQTEEEAFDTLDDLYSQIETLEDLIVADPYRENAAEVESKIKDLYQEVHTYWEPKRSRAKLHHMLNSMEMSGIDQLFDTNASKKTTVVPVKLNENEYTDLSASKSATSGLFKFMQVETSGVKDKITLPTQARQLLTTYINKLNTKAYNNKSLAQLAAEYSATLGKIAKVNTKALDDRILDKDGNINTTELYEMMYEGLRKQGADENTLKFFEIKNGQPEFNPNMPVIKKIFTYYYFSMFNDSIFSESVSGRSDILVSSYGHDVLYDTETGDIITSAMQDEDPDAYKSERYRTRPLGVSVETINGQNVYTVEVIIPEPLAKNESERQLYLERLNKFFSTRIPTEDKRSMIVCKVVDYMDASYRNSIVVPQLVHILAGSDLDVDKLYSHTFAHYIDFNGEAHVYGDYTNFNTPSQGRFVEYINYMMNNNSAIKDSIDAEIKNVTEKPVFTSDFMKLKDELGLSDMSYEAEEFKEARKNLSVLIDAASTEVKELRNRQNLLFDNHIKLNARRGSAERNAWAESKALYLQKKEELDALIREKKLFDNTIKLAATVNVLKSMGLPTTQSSLTSYTKENGSPVVTVLQNESLQQKMDILSNEEVFNNFYIQERSSVEPFRDIAKSIGASVEDVVKQNSIYSIMGDVVANQLNSSNKDGIGIAASFNKFIAFAEKSGLSLQFDLFGTDSVNGMQQHSDFLNDDGIRNIGAELGMFADAAKDPIPSVLNLNPETSSTSNLLISMSGNIQLGILINKIPFIEAITNEVANSKSAAQTNESRFDFKNTAGLLKERIVNPGIVELKDKGRLGEIFAKDEEDNIVMGKYLPMFIETITPAGDLAKMDPEEVTLENVGFVVKYEDGTAVAEDVASIYLANVYKNTYLINSDIIKLGRILNLIKDQKPDFNQLDMMLADVAYFMSGDSVFGESIIKILASSSEYMPLIKAAQKMSDYSKQLLIERTPLFKSINNILQSNLSSARDPKSKQNISDQITKLIIIQKSKVELQRELKKLEGKEDEGSVRVRSLYENALKYFTADYWINNNSFLDDLDYLYTNNPGNPFVEFLKVNARGNMNFLEGSTRMKLDKDIAENINNGFEALEKSSDLKTQLLSRQMFYYLLVKDGLGYSNNSFLSYINPSIKQYKQTSNYLDQFQQLLADQQKFIDEQNSDIQKIAISGLKDEQKKEQIKKIADRVYNNYLSLFDKFFNAETPGKTDWINLIVRKIFSNVSNQKYIREYRGGNIQEKASKDYVNELIDLNVFSNIEAGTKVTGKRFDFSDEEGSTFNIDFTPISDSQVDPQFEVVFGNIFLPGIDMEGKLRRVDFPMLIKNSEGRLFKLMAIDERSISEDIAFQSITGIYKGTQGLKAEYREIEVEGAKSLLNFGFTQTDAIALHEHSSKKNTYSEENDLLAMGVDPSELSDNKSATTVRRQVKNVSTAAKLTAQAEERRRANQAAQEGRTYTPGEVIDEVTPEMQAMIDAAKAKRDAKKQGKPVQAQPVQQQEKISTIQLLPENEQKIKDGIKSITNRTLKQKVDDGVYAMSDGTQVEVKLLGLYNVEYIGDAVIVTSNTGGPTFSGDDYAKAEGFKDWIDFQENNNFSKNFVDGNQSRYVYAVKLVQKPSETMTPTSTSTRTVEYTPKGKEKQTYTIEGARILNKNGEEVFKEDSVDRNKIFANLAVKEGRAVIVNYRGIKYVVNNKGQIISGATGKVMQWGEQNGDRQAILALANKTKAEVTAAPGTPMADPNVITDADVAAIYKDKVDYLKAQNLPIESLESFSARAKKVQENLKKINASKEAILETIKCL